jgi:hypothetical protein
MKPSSSNSTSFHPSTLLGGWNGMENWIASRIVLEGFGSGKYSTGKRNVFKGLCNRPLPKTILEGFGKSFLANFDLEAFSKTILEGFGSGKRQQLSALKGINL